MKVLDRPLPTERAAPSPEAEALIREARRRERRRRIGAALGLVLVSGVVATIVGVIGGGNDGRTTSTPTSPVGAPTLNAGAFAHEGDLAFVSRGTLWVLTGGSGRLQKITVAKGFFGSSPAFSADGRWMSFVASKPTNRGIITQLWFAHADGSDAHEISGLRNPVVIGWSPRSDVLAVTNQGVVHTPHGSFDSQTSVWLASPSGARRELAVAEGIEGGTWSPDGSELAIAIDSGGIFPGRPRGIFQTLQSYGPWETKLIAYPVNGGKPTVWFNLKSTTSLGSNTQNLLLPVGWWPKWGIGFWTVTLGEYEPSVVNNGVLDLWHVGAPKSRPELFGNTLANGTLSKIVAASNGELAIANDELANANDLPNAGEGGVGILQDQQVERCSPTTSKCVNVTEPPGTESLDPVWSPNGSDLAYIVGKEFGEPFNQSVVANWYDSLQLWLYNAKNGTSVDVASTKGAVVPLWSQDGKSLLYVANNGLWLWKDLKGTPVEIAGPLFSAIRWPPRYYGGPIDWTDQFAWSK
jgi:hypothetical protein